MGQGPTIRHRTRSGLPIFDLDRAHAELCPSAHFLFDRVTYNFRVPVVFPNAAAAEDWLALVCDQVGNDKPLFRLAYEGRGGKWRMKFHTGWHLSGECDLVLNRQCRGHLVVQLVTNPTRWMRARGHQDVESVIAVLGGNAVVRIPTLRRELS